MFLFIQTPFKIEANIYVFKSDTGLRNFHEKFQLIMKENTGGGNYLLITVGLIS